ncbi:MAG: TlpA family protein disulfide reductase [Candidatus Omnitrophica bacterium]|nr:TlpA family protein disulfide reductase [Candidatus Omnitrophota bacterium]
MKKNDAVPPATGPAACGTLPFSPVILRAASGRGLPFGVTRGWRVFSFCLLVLITGCGGSDGSGEAVSSRRLTEDQYFTLRNLEGEAVRFDEVLEGKKAVLLNFWATWCPPCREEIPDLVELQARRGGDSFTVLGVDVGESAAKVRAFSEKMGINYPLLLDDDMEVARAYGVVGIPTSLLVASDGMIVGEYHGYTSKLVSDVEAVLKREAR